MKSMTGYAYGEGGSDGISISVELKSYNSRFIDLSINVPYWLGRLENRLREYLSERIQRGKVELNIRIKERVANLQVVSDLDAAQAYLGAVRDIAHAIGNTGEIPLSLIIAQEGVLKSDRALDMESYWAHILPVLEVAYAEFDGSRVTEGKALYEDIAEMLQRIENSAGVISQWIPEMEKLFKDTIRTRFLEIIGNSVDEQRILQETASLMVKYSINEEIVRLRSHLASLQKELVNNPSPGRKIDFICQEINREVNTIGSKNQILEVGQAVIDAKDALENIREQMRNIE